MFGLAKARLKLSQSQTLNFLSTHPPTTHHHQTKYICNSNKFQQRGFARVFFFFWILYSYFTYFTENTSKYSFHSIKVRFGCNTHKSFVYFQHRMLQNISIKRCPIQIMGTIFIENPVNSGIPPYR